MKMEPLRSGGLRIWMTHADLRQWGLCLNTMSAKDTATRHALLRLLTLAEERYSLPSQTKLTAEVLPIEGGCLLVLTPRQLPRAAEPTVYTVHTADDLLRLGRELNRHPCDTLPTSSLFEWDGKYRLIVYTDSTPPPALKRLLREFAELTATGFTAVAATEEYGKPLVIGQALQAIHC